MVHPVVAVGVVGGQQARVEVGSGAGVHGARLPAVLDLGGEKKFVRDGGKW